MPRDQLMNLIDGIASDFLFLEDRDIDIPTAGRFLNQLDTIIRGAEALKIEQLSCVARGLSRLLEKKILDEIKDTETAFAAFAKGITIMQEMDRSFSKGEDQQANISSFMESLVCLTGATPVFELEGGTVEKSMEPCDEKDVGAERRVEIQDESLLKDFIIEGLEYINEIEVNILNLEQDPGNKDCVNSIFRPFHSIKGVASFLNLEEIRDLAHNLESLLDKVRNNELSVTSQIIDIILDGADTLKAMIGQVRDRMEGRPAAILEIDLSTLKQRIGFAQKGKYEQTEPKKIGAILVEDGLISEGALEETLEHAQKAPDVKIGEALIAEGKVTPKQVSQALRKQMSQVVDVTSIRVDTRKLDDLIDMVGELVITQSMIRQSPIVLSNMDRKFFRDISQLCSITSELQRTSTSLRMIPIKQTFQRMSRLVRDLSRSAGKLVNVVTEGEDTEIDRNMVEEIYNPLVHLIRNAVDHGIEAPDERTKAGKGETGTIQLKAYHKGGNILIEICDDGKGLHKEKILNKAIAKGTISSAAGLSDQDVYRLILLPGFSTAERVTDVSGRGVGMDVVKQAVDKLRGKIEISSRYGHGTTFVTTFPLTLAIIDGMIVRVGREKYIVPTAAIRRLLRPNKEYYNTVIGRGEVINVMGNLLPLVRLHDLFDIEPDCRNPWEATVVVVDGENGSKCLLVDEIMGQEEVVIKGLSESLRHVRGVSGGAILGDGNIGLILDPEGLFELSELQSHGGNGKKN
ncbi:MAG: chemotaxis protein CheA [Syntrophales bacterium]|jgi:two-component system, chemotaxis family, sensor kinase CheA